jgi:hypothetical protein
MLKLFMHASKLLSTFFLYDFIGVDSPKFQLLPERNRQFLLSTF